MFYFRAFLFFSQIGFRAIRGAEFSADIALDNVKVTRGEC